MSVVTLARHAMATRFELVLHGNNPIALRAAGEQALDEIDRLEGQLSLYRPTSEIAHLNALAAKQPVRVTPAVFALLQHARQLHDETGGAFDITIGPLVRCWGFMGGTGRLPHSDEVAEARKKVGMHQVVLNPNSFTVQFTQPGVMLDLGAIGKGYAIERAVEVLREAGINSALLHGGTSTVYALGYPPEAEFWKIAIPRPRTNVGQPSSLSLDFSLSQKLGEIAQACGLSISGPDSTPGQDRQDACPTFLATVPLKDEAMSISAVWGRCFRSEGKILGHVLDPRTGQPVTGALLSAVVLPSATETDALSTALLTLGAPGYERVANLRPGMRTLVVSEAGGKLHVEARGIAKQAA